MELPVFIHKTSARSSRLGLKIDQRNQLTVTSPPGVSKAKIEQFVLDHLDWIKVHQAKNAVRTNVHNAQTIHLFGKKYEKTVSADGDTALGVSIKGSRLCVRLPEGTAVTLFESKAEKALQAFMKTTATQYIIPRVHTLAKKMQTSFAKLTLRDTSSRWGSCSSRGNLQFSWRLVHFSPAIIDYVIIHELAHRTHMNHSAAFWQLVAKYDRDYHQHRASLKRSIV